MHIKLEDVPCVYRCHSCAHRGRQELRRLVNSLVCSKCGGAGEKRKRASGGSSDRFSAECRGCESRQKGEYARSEGGKAVVRRYQLSYRSTARGREVIARAASRYWHSEKGKAANRRAYRIRRKTKDVS